MSAADEIIVKAFFETLGFLTHQTSKYQVQSRKKRAEEEIDFFIFNPNAPENTEQGFVLDAAGLKQIKYAVVSVKAWHTSQFTPSLIANTKGIFSFLKKPTSKKAEEFFPKANPQDIKKIMIIPAFANTAKLKQETIFLLKNAGVSGAITYPQMLQHLVDSVEINNNYSKSDLLQVLRILKNCGMIKSTQLELFKK